MISVFLLQLYLGVGDTRKLISGDMYFRSVTDCNWYAAQLTKRYGNYGQQGLMDARDRVTSYCVPKEVNEKTTRIY